MIAQHRGSNSNEMATKKGRERLAGFVVLKAEKIQRPLLPIFKDFSFKDLQSRKCAS